MDWIMNNISIVLGIAIIVFIIVNAFLSFIKLPKAQKIADVKEWLKWAVTEAEKAYGTKTGQIKLRKVYDLFLNTFPEMKNYISFSDIDMWVNDALKWFENQLKSNESLYKYVYGDEDDGDKN